MFCYMFDECVKKHGKDEKIRPGIYHVQCTTLTFSKSFGPKLLNKISVKICGKIYAIQLLQKDTENLRGACTTSSGIGPVIPKYNFVE